MHVARHSAPAPRTAAGTSFTPAGNIAATTVQAALEELDSEKAVATAVREKLSANRTYYVRTDGSDSNTGLADTAGGAFLTPQKAMDVVAGLDISIYTVTVNVRAGTYTGTLTLKTVVGGGTVQFIGDETTPANVTISVTGGNAVSGGVAIGTFVVAGFKLASSNTIDAIFASSLIVTLRNNEYAGTASYRIYSGSGAYVKMAGSANKISGGGSGFMIAERLSQIEDFGATYTLTANVTYISAFVVCRSLSILTCLATFTLGGFSVTGARYSVTLNGIINTSGGGASFFPGSTGGSSATGGQYA